MGCTTCHQGVGRRLDFVRAAHTPDTAEQEERWAHELGWREADFVLYPMLPRRHVEGQCLKCHKPALEYRPIEEPLERWEEKTGSDGRTERVRALAPKPVDSPRRAEVDGRWRPETLERGRRVMREHGCTACHQIRDFVGYPGWPAEEAEVPPFDLAAPAPGAQTAYGEAKVGPDLTHVKDKTTKAWGIRWIENPTAFKIDTRMPAFYRHRLHDDRWNPVLGPDGKPQDATVVVNPEPRDLVQIDVETLALATFLFDGQPGSRASTYEDPPAGDVEKGRQIFYSMGCYACHLGPDDRAGSALPEPTLRRFERRDDVPPGPRLIGLGSKLNAKWLNAWLAEPRHYNSVTRMPNLRWRDETGPDGKTVTRTAAQLRADVTAYLLSSKDAEFEARPVPDPVSGTRWTKEHEYVLLDFWKEWYGKTKADPADPSRRITMPAEEADQVAADVGRRLIGYRGCFGCHNVTGYEKEQPIGKELTAEGSQDLHKFDFGILSHEEVPHTRWDWIENKLRQPRIYDKGRFKPRWNDKLRMPRFNLTEEDRQAVTAVVLGLVKDPIKPGALYAPDEAMRKVAAGRAVIERYGCNQCHTIENRLGVLAAEQLDRSMEGWMLPPNLHGQGNRTKADWLFRFLKAPFDVRPGVIQRMPMFRLSDAEVAALVDYFTAVAGRPDRFATDPEDHALDTTPYPAPVTITVKMKDEAGNEADREIVVHNRLEEAKGLFDTLNCVKCHLPKGTPGADPNEGASAPPFTLAHERLRRAWMFDMVHDPQRQIQGTKMPSFWQPKSRRTRKPGDSYTFTYPQFLCGARGRAGATKDDVAEAQMADVVRYILWHYQMPGRVPPAEPAAGK
jgi:cbb3-type cytochrome oxidase cytochrome c subunit/mono/diheme cytochrome c family protein